jgi:NADPH2:quinone reductase
VLIYTAAGGVGSAAVNLALIAGMKVIGVAGSEAKRCAVQALGAQHAINYRSEDVVARVAEITGGRGVDLILDPIGGKGFGRNFEMLAPLGMVVSYGRRDGCPDPDLLSAMRAQSSKSPAVRFFTIHSFDDRPDIRAATMRLLPDHLAAGSTAVCPSGPSPRAPRERKAHRQGTAENREPSPRGRYDHADRSLDLQRFERLWLNAITAYRYTSVK